MKFPHPPEDKNILQISTQDLMEGMYVTKLDKPWKESPFLFQGFFIENAQTIEQLKDECTFVYIDTCKHNPDLPIPLTYLSYAPFRKKKKNWLKRLFNFLTTILQPKNKHYDLDDIVEKRINLQDIDAYPNTSSIEEEAINAQQLYNELSHQFNDFLKSVRENAVINEKMANKMVKRCLDSILKTPDALMLMTSLEEKDTYTFQHSLNICILSLGLGKQLNLPIPELETIGLCGLLHDIGKIHISDAILNKPGVFSSDEYVNMQQHPSLGMELLKSNSNIQQSVIEAVYSHHERLDGKGYPRGLKGKQISPYAKLIAIIDVYDAITNDRIYKKGRTHFETINLLLEQSEHCFDKTLVEAFIRCLGIYPVGSIVELTNGMVALVVEINELSKLKPKIILLLDELKQPMLERLVDLAKLEVDSGNQPFVIRTIVHPSTYQIDVIAYMQDGLLNNIFAFKEKDENK